MLGSVVGSTRNKNGAIRFVSDMNPACWQNSRLGLIAKCYEKYRVDKMTVTYIPNVGTNFIGTVALYVDTDPLEAQVATTGTSALQAVSQNQFVTVGPCWSRLTCEYRRDKDDTRLHYASVDQDEDLRETSPGNIYLWTNNDDLLSLGHIYVEYDITFHYPEVEFSEAGENYVFSTGLPLSNVAGDAMEVNTLGGISAAIFPGSLQQVRVVNATNTAGASIDSFMADVNNSTIDIKAGDLLWGLSVLIGVGQYAWRFYTSRAAAQSPGNYIKMITNAGGVTISAAGRLLFRNA